MSDSWVPPKGKRSVAPGSSLTRALLARKSGRLPGKGPRHIREFYSFRCEYRVTSRFSMAKDVTDNFKPPSVDSEERGKVTVEGNNVTVERPSTQSSEAHKWIGQEAPAKEWDCVLIYDEANDSYTLEKLESVLTLKHQPRTTINEPPPSASSNKHSVTYNWSNEERGSNAGGHDDDAEGDDYFEEILPDALKQEEEEEEEEGEEGEVLPLPPRPATKAPIKPIPTPKPTYVHEKLPPKPIAHPPAPIPAIKPTPAQPPPPTSASLLKAPPKPVPLPRGKKSKREPEPAPPTSASNHLSDADEEDLQFGKPAKRARQSPPRSRGLALPSASTAAFIPPAPAPGPTTPVEPIDVAEESEEDEEWDEVAAVGKAVDIQDDFDVFGDATGAADGGEEIGMDELERELNMHMDEEEEEEDFLAAVVEEAPPARGAPLSLSQLSELAAATYVSDDYSSSEESDED
ncbi:hypothetical protein H0H87_002316 [Tephrocybe sp. NHM501043]|nr:hypothetical protein H0H87_002316 [Tephrocybe sp. NHM501043]